MTWVIDPKERLFRAWGSVEIRDGEGQLIPMDEFKTVMPVLMRRGGFIIDSHSNRVHGKLLDYDFKDKMVKGVLKPGIIVTGKVFKDYKSDDDFWDDIKNGKAKGMSFGGKTNHQHFEMIDGVPTEVLKEIEAFELSVVRGDKVPINQEATMISANKIAKAADSKIFIKLGSVPVCINCAKEEGALLKSAAYDRCVERVKETVKPQEGRTKEESAHAICQERVNKLETGPGGHTRDGTGPYGLGYGPGSGSRECELKLDIKIKPSILKMIRKARQPVKIVIKPEILKRIRNK